MRPKLKSISSLKKKADNVFSIWIRDRDKACVTCGSRNNLQCGHFVSRSHNILRFDERNAHAQCVGCNVFKNGNMVVYAKYMMTKYGPQIIDDLLREKNKLKQFTRGELEDIIRRYSLPTV